MTVQVGATIAALDILSARFRSSVQEIIGNAALEARDIAQEIVPIGDPDNATDPPGTLRESIYATPARSFKKVVKATTRTNLVYAWQRERGGPINAKSTLGMWFVRYGELWAGVMHVWQEPHPYMQPARDRVAAKLYDRGVVALTEVIETT